MTAMPVEKIRDEIDPLSDEGRLLFDESPAGDREWIETFLTVPSEHGQIVPFKLYPQQVMMLNDANGRDVTIKARQTRASSLIMARNVRAMTTGLLWGATCLVGAQDDQTTENGFRQRIRHHILNDLANKGFKFDIRADNPNELVIGGLDNRFIFISGEQRTMSRGYAVQRMHLSEFAHWKQVAAELLGGAIPAVPAGGRIDLESTPRGEDGEFYDRAMMAFPNNPKGLWLAHLYPWWLESRYRVSPDPMSGCDIVLSSARFLQEMADFSPSEHEGQLMHDNTLDVEQILWRRYKKEELDATPTPFLQEYPEDMDTCWLGTQGRFFDTSDGVDHLEAYRDAREAPIKMIESLLYRGASVSMHGANVAVWEFPNDTDSYCLAFDAAGGGIGKDSDFTVAYVWSANKEKIVARLRIQASPKQTAPMIAALAFYYKNATISGERSHHGAIIFEELRELNYTNIYYHVDPMKGLSKGQRAEAGVYPTEKLRQQILEKFKAGITSHAISSKCAELVREMNGFTWVKVQQRLKAQADTSGLHDDCIFAAAHGWFIIDKVRRNTQRGRESRDADVVTIGQNGRVIRRGDQGSSAEDLWRM